MVLSSLSFSVPIFPDAAEAFLLPSPHASASFMQRAGSAGWLSPSGSDCEAASQVFPADPTGAAPESV